MENPDELAQTAAHREGRVNRYRTAIRRLVEARGGLDRPFCSKQDMRNLFNNYTIPNRIRVELQPGSAARMLAATAASGCTNPACSKTVPPLSRTLGSAGRSDTTALFRRRARGGPSCVAGAA